MNTFSPDNQHEYLIKNMKRKLAFDENADYDTWKKAVKDKLTELLGDMPEEKVPLNVRKEWEREHDDFREIRFVYDTEPDMSVPCHLLIPHNAKKPCPVVICLQGHSSGMHVSLGRIMHEADEKAAQHERDNGSRDRDFAITAVKQGYAALVVEQRGFGERRRKVGTNPGTTTCEVPSMVALLLGRTMIGERVWDISRAIDALYEFEEIDTERIACMGNSGGGTATYYAACMDERIKAAMPSCSVCAFDQSIGIMRHCTCNYIPRMAKYFDMGELACLIAPRKLIDVMGMTDVGFLASGSFAAYDTIKRIYKKAGCEDNCTLVIGEKGHRFYADLGWKAFKEMTGWK